MCLTFNKFYTQNILCINDSKVIMHKIFCACTGKNILQLEHFPKKYKKCVCYFGINKKYMRIKIMIMIFKTREFENFDL